MKYRYIKTLISYISIDLALYAAPRVNFKRDIKPILEKHCVRCHGPQGAARNLRLDKQQRAMMAITPRHPEDSRAYLAAKAGIMPPGPQKLTTGELETLRRWIAAGARWPKNLELEVVIPNSPDVR